MCLERRGAVVWCAERCVMIRSDRKDRRCDYVVVLTERVNFFFFFQAEDGIRDLTVTGVQTCALPICAGTKPPWRSPTVPAPPPTPDPPIRRCETASRREHPTGRRPDRADCVPARSQIGRAHV